MNFQFFTHVCSNIGCSNIAKRKINNRENADKPIKFPQNLLYGNLNKQTKQLIINWESSNTINA